MPTLTITQNWSPNGIPTNATAVTYGLTRDDTSQTVVSPGTPLPNIATGVYQATLPGVDPSTTYTATVTLVYESTAYTFTVACVASIDATAIQWPDGFTTILTQLMRLVAQITASQNPTYSVEGHSYSKGEYLDILSRQVEHFMKLYSQANPFEIVS